MQNYFRDEGIFRNCFDTRFSSVQICHGSNPPTYGLYNLLGGEIRGRLYEQELQKMLKENNDEYIVDNSFERTRRRQQ